MDQFKIIGNELIVSDRIVTYKTAAAILQVDVNDAKTILDTFVTDLKSKGESLCVTYVVGGITSEDKHKIVLIPDSKYDQAKAFFRTITVDHIYSMQKSPHLEWAAIANVDDFMREDKTVEPVDAPNNVEKHVATTKTNDATSKNNSKPANKKGALSNFFTQSANAKNPNKLLNNKEQSKTGAKKEPESKKVKPSMLASFITKNNSNKENNSKVSNGIKTTTTTAACTVVKTEDEVTLTLDSDNEDEDFVMKKNKKRSRVLHDDDDDTPTNKVAKVDILDDNDEEELQHEMSSEDIFGSPERGEESCDVEESVPSDVTEKDSQSTVPSEPVDSMYEDDDGYFVTERTPSSKKKIDQVPKQLEESKKELETKEKAGKKQITQKIKANTNQKTLFNFFTKK